MEVKDEKWINGQVIEMTAEEIAKMDDMMEQLEQTDPTTEERINALEEALLEMITGGEG